MTSLKSVRHAIFERYFIALEHRDFRTIWWANITGGAAAWALIVARGWLAYKLSGGSSAQVGLTTFMAMVPLFIVPPFIGVLADRMDRRKLLGWTYGINLAHNVILAALALTGVIQIWHLLALGFLNGVARSASMTAMAALVPNLVPRERLLNALSLNSATFSASRLIGPGLIAPLMATVGAGGAFVLCTVFYAIGFYQVLQVRTTARGGVKAGENPIKAFTDGLAYTYRQPLIRAAILIVAAHCGLTMAYESLLPSLSANELNGGNTGFSVLMSGVGAGALVGSLWIGGVHSAIGRGRALLVLGILSGVAMLGIGFAPNLPLAIVAAAVAGAAQAAFMTITQAISQALADDRFRGRVASVVSFHIGGLMALVNLANGSLADVFHASTIFWVSGLIFAGLMVFTFATKVLRTVYLHGLPDVAMARAGAR